MQIRKNNLKVIISNNYYLLFFLILYLTVLLGFYFDEDNLGGAIFDSTYHFKISEEFNKNFLYTFENFGDRQKDLGTRNSPIFWIFLSIFEKYFSYDVIRFFNTLIIFAIAVVFYKSLLLKFKDVQSYHLLILSSFIFLSPSLRSLAIWPYSLIWGLFFFVLSIYYYLKFKDHLNFNKSSIVLLNVIFAAYIYPAFSVFYLFYFLQILKKIKKLDCFKLIFFSFILSIPCIIYLSSKDLSTTFTTQQGIQGASLSRSLNISNKILIISSIFLYFILPIINIKEIFLKVKKISYIKIIFILIFFLANIYFFDFPHDKWGGGFFHKVSNILFKNNYLFFFSAFISIFIIFILIEKKFQNYLLLIILILYNPQLTIYIKYFDPLIFIIFLTLFDFDFKKHFVNKTYKYYQFYGVIIFYYIGVYSKKIFF